MRPRTSIYPLFVLIWAVLALVCSAIGLLSQNVTPIANLRRVTVLYPTNILAAVAQPN